MHLFIDPREGSNRLLKTFEGNCESVVLDAGDVAFSGVGPSGDWLVGIEYKTLEDVCGCIKSGRFTGTQLPRMMRLYDICFLLIEGIGLLDYHTGQFSKRLGNMTYGFGLPYASYENFLTSVAVHSALAGKPCIVKRAANIKETEAIIRAIYSWFQKPWEQHTSISRPDQTKMQRVAYDLEIATVNADDPDYPKYILRKFLYQIPGIGWAVASHLSDKCANAETAMTLSQKDWESFGGVGKGLAKRIFRSLHGRDDIITKKQKTKPARADCGAAGITPDGGFDPMVMDLI